MKAMVYIVAIIVGLVYAVLSPIALLLWIGSWSMEIFDRMSRRLS